MSNVFNDTARVVLKIKTAHLDPVQCTGCTKQMLFYLLLKTSNYFMGFFVKISRIKVIILLLTSNWEATGYPL